MWMALVCCLLTTAGASAANTVEIYKRWTITVSNDTKIIRMNYLREEGKTSCPINNLFPEATYDNADGVSRSVTSASFAEMAVTKKDVEDEAFGTGRCVSITFSKPDNGDDVSMVLDCYIFDDHDYMLTQLSLQGDASIRSNYLAPIAVSGYALFTNNPNNRMLKVPFDNDGFGRYCKYKMDCEMTSYEVTACYSGEARNGFVFGAVDHNRWKNAVTVSAKNNGTLNSLKVFSGVSTSETRDVIAHGKVNGPVVSSARMFVGVFEDWRDGMEEYARANTLVAPAFNNWTGGTPFGWQSWGVMESKNSYEADLEIADYYYDVLRPGGFCNSEGGPQIISLDAGDNLQGSNRKDLAAYAKERNQVTGSYATPFSLWWSKDDNLEYEITLGGNKYQMKDAVLKANGEPIWYDGAWARDPTHPWTLQDIGNYFRSVNAEGVKYIKMDFMSNGIIQADSYYRPEITTAVEAYNYGMSYIKAQAAKYGIFVALSIAPLFPYQYATSRRIACDTWGTIGHTEYSMNAISAGWWTNLLYQYNDPDHLVLIGNGDQKTATEGENRARYTNGAATGMMLVADNFSPSDNSGQGSNVMSRSRATKIMLNKDVNEMADLGRSFRPVYGYKEYNGNADGAECFFMHHTDRYLYVPVINYSSSAQLSGTIPLELLGIAEGDFDEVKELWTGEAVSLTQDGLPYAVPQKDARIYRFRKIGGGSGINDRRCPVEKSKAVVRTDGNVVSVAAGAPMERIDVFNLRGQMVGTIPADGKDEAAFVSPSGKGLIVLRIVYADGTSENCKAVL